MSNLLLEGETVERRRLTIPSKKNKAFSKENDANLSFLIAAPDGKTLANNYFSRICFHIAIKSYNTKYNLKVNYSSELLCLIWPLVPG